MRTYIGVDPGKTGAIAIVRNRVIEFRDWPNYQVLFDLFPIEDNIFICIEKAQAMPKQGVVSMFKYGVDYGFYLGIFTVKGYAYQEVSPQTWKREFGLIGKDKMESIHMAKKIYPCAAEELTRKKDHGRAEALLLAEYARRKNM